MNLIANAAVYDFGQTLAGARASRTRLGRLFKSLSVSGRMLDIGGGTGSIQPYLTSGTAYMCLELEAPKPRRLMAKFPGTAATLSDASRLPVRTGSVENVLTIAVPHHLGNPAWELMLSETHRVLKPGGYLFLLEPLKYRALGGPDAMGS